MTTGVVLLNMGGPDSIKSVRPFLYNLFSDRKIIRLGPVIFQKPIAWLIARNRTSKSAACYEKIGGKSPILEITTRQALALQKELNKSRGSAGQYECVPGMRYYAPRTPVQVSGLAEKGMDRLVGLSMYPHYSLATSGSSIEDFMKAARRCGFKNPVVVDSYPEHPLYIKALAECLKTGIKSINDRQGFRLIYSAHSLPVKMVEQGDPYVDHVKKTIFVLERETGIRGQLCFQSRSGPVRWLEPATDALLHELAAKGVKEILCMPISFVSDHVETLYEIDLLYTEMMKKEGVRLVRTPSLNVNSTFIRCLRELVLGCN